MPLKRMQAHSSFVFFFCLCTDIVTLWRLEYRFSMTHFRRNFAKGLNSAGWACVFVVVCKPSYTVSRRCLVCLADYLKDGHSLNVTLPPAIMDVFYRLLKLDGLISDDTVHLVREPTSMSLPSIRRNASPPFFPPPGFSPEIERGRPWGLPRPYRERNASPKVLSWTCPPDAAADFGESYLRRRV